MNVLVVGRRVVQFGTTIDALRALKSINADQGINYTDISATEGGEILTSLISVLEALPKKGSGK